MRGLLRLLLPAVLVAGAIGALGYELQGGLLEQPARGTLAAAAAGRWLVRYRHARSEVQLTGRPAWQGDCVEGWRPLPGGIAHTRATALVLSNGRELVAEGGEVWNRRGRPLRPQTSWALLLLAGCPRLLAAKVAQVLLGERPVHERLESTDRRRVLALGLPTKPARLVLLVDPRTQKPLAVELAGRGISGRSELSLTALRPALARRFVPLFAPPPSARALIDFPG